MFRKIDKIYDMIALINYRLKSRCVKSFVFNFRYLMTKSLVMSIEDVKEYLGITTNDVIDFAKLWAEKEMLLFKNKKDVQSFYTDWKDDYAKYNICANVLNQHFDTINFQIIHKYFTKEVYNKDTLIDYGCGTGSLSFAFAIEKLINSKIILLDVENDINEFIRFRIKKHQLQDIISLYNVMSFKGWNVANGLYCIDVLEHVENSSEIFINNIHPLLRKNGLLYLKAPWRGQLTHIGDRELFSM
ncbi:MAG: hypothetical protein JETT_1506 [Candidatus Jettenia ecosi]|uniref:Methyltransferase domain-containing protein n=1 Tax=Candidatus Jettenia ecosi TaxID=2494326 RepID=A0A533QC12_9BACT|nr:MAG: hypothetical protein JETT_1506 [Candidatus Jettenia ecosi]